MDLFGLRQFKATYLGFGAIQKFVYSRYPYSNDPKNYTGNIVQSITFALEDKGWKHERVQYGFMDFFNDVGGAWFGITRFCIFLVALFHSDMLYRKLVEQFYRRPEVYKYAYADILQKPSNEGKLSQKELENMQIEENQKSANKRSQNELDGKIKLPPKLVLFYENFRKLLGFPCDMMMQVDQVCY